MKNITFEDRKIIEVMIKRGKGKREIARRLHRNHTIIIREINRNTGDYLPYNAQIAQKRFEKRKFGKRKKKLETNMKLKEYVTEKIREDWSPEQISGRLKLLEKQGKDPPDQISHETIYQYLFSKEMKSPGLWKHLRTRRKKRLKWGRKHRDIKIPNRVSIHERPLAASLKSEIGHWEGDTIESCKAGKGGLSTHYEKSIQLCRIHKLISKEALETENAWKETIDSHPQYIFKTWTLDNGVENTKHETLHEYNVDTYFCDPYSSWQKGGVENLNKLIRQYFPKGTDFFDVDEEEIIFVEKRLNNRPRKLLGFISSNEALNNYLQGGALNT